jgi:hypothetical protein
LQTSEPKTCLVLKDENLVKLVTQFLVETCKSSGKDLLLVSHALDTFFDIYAENYYNKQLLEQNVIQLMSEGLPGLKQLY